MTLRRCLDCPTLSPNPRCPEHTRKRDQARGTRQQRGYDSAYDRERRRLVAAEERGARYFCWHCGCDLMPGGWQLGHDKQDRSVIRGPECTACNLNTASRIAPDA